MKGINPNMLNELHLKNAFVHKDLTIKFDKGLTLIKGPNESGKSLIFEMIRYALFGSKALRGAVTAYKNLEVTLKFTVSKNQYVVSRTPKDVLLKSGENVLLARGTTAVNGKIIELLGYGMNTFDNINAINQTQVNKLTDLKAQDRKKFIDDLIKADQIDSLIEEYASEAKTLSTVVETLKGTLSTPIEPIDDSGSPYTASELRVAIKAADDNVRSIERNADRVAAIEAQISRLRTGTELDKYPTLSIEEVQSKIDAVSSHNKRIRDLDWRIGKLNELGFVPTQDEYDTLVSACERGKKLYSYLVPKYNMDTLKAQLYAHTEQEAWNRITLLRSMEQEYQSCPRCGKDFSAEADPIRKEIAELEPIARAHKTLISKERIEEQIQLVADHAIANEKFNEIPEHFRKMAIGTTFEVNFTLEEIDKGFDLLKESLEPTKDLVDSLRFKQNLNEIAKLELERDSIQLDDLTEAKELAAKVRSDLEKKSTYELLVSIYETELAKNKKAVDQLEETKSEEEAKKNIVKALQGFKYYVNTYFLPSVSKTASQLINIMTNATRRSIYINEKFEVYVDNQEVSTLSGSAKALVNIALRLALQYVLTRNSFSVFMGDEIDASMDKSRAAYLAECLNNMTGHIDQLILISHRDIDADQEVNL